jgi:CRP/FNR family transcriptional regulator, anaerobic regulatory protein
MTGPVGKTDFDATDRWLDLFPALKDLAPEDMSLACGHVRFPEIEQGGIAYRQGWECPNYVMCIEGGTRTFKTSSAGRELLIYRVAAGGTCVFTTQCLLAGGTFPAESTAETPTRLAVLPAGTFHELMKNSAPFRHFVLDDYANLLASMISLVDEVAFSSLDERLAGRLLSEADSEGLVSKTHQQIALDLGSVREVISRYLAEWERAGWIKTARGRIEIVDRSALARYRAVGT